MNNQTFQELPLYHWCGVTSQGENATSLLVEQRKGFVYPSHSATSCRLVQVTSLWGHHKVCRLNNCQVHCWNFFSSRNKQNSLFLMHLTASACPAAAGGTVCPMAADLPRQQPPGWEQMLPHPSVLPSPTITQWTSSPIKAASRWQESCVLGSSTTQVLSPCLN